MLAVLAPEGRCLEFVWHCVALQVRRGQSFAIRDEAGVTLAIGGIFATERLREVWFNVAPAAAPRLRAVARASRLTLSDLCQSDPRPVFTIARTRAGETIARQIGFAPRGDGAWQWEWPHDGDRRQAVRECG